MSRKELITILNRALEFEHAAQAKYLCQNHDKKMNSRSMVMNGIGS